MKFPENKPNVKPEFRADGYPEGWCCSEAQKMLTELIEQLNPKVVAEVGSFKGMSAYHIMKNTTKTELWCIDHWQGSPEHARMGIDCTKLYETFIVNLWEYKDRINIIRESSVNGLRELYDKGIKPEIIYVDGAHDEENVYNDVLCCWELFPEAIICGDDWTLKGVRDGVMRFCNEQDATPRLYNDRVWRLRFK